jgi:hypothetical protein
MSQNPSATTSYPSLDMTQLILNVGPVIPDPVGWTYPIIELSQPLAVFLVVALDTALDSGREHDAEANALEEARALMEFLQSIGAKAAGPQDQARRAA